MTPRHGKGRCDWTAKSNRTKNSLAEGGQGASGPSKKCKRMRNLHELRITIAVASVSQPPPCHTFQELWHEHTNGGTDIIAPNLSMPHFGDRRLPLIRKEFASLKTHPLLLHARLAVQVVGVEPEVPWAASGSLEHLHHGHGRDGLEGGHPQEDLGHRAGGNRGVVCCDGRYLQ